MKLQDIDLELIKDLFRNHLQPTWYSNTIANYGKYKLVLVVNYLDYKISTNMFILSEHMNFHHLTINHNDVTLDELIDNLTYNDLIIYRTKLKTN